MASSKQNYHYTFQEADGPTLLHNNAKYNWNCIKTEDDGDGFPVETYHLWSNVEDHSDLLCDCPASYHHARRGRCKHTRWLMRWIAIKKQREEELERGSNKPKRELLNPFYYDAATDRFYPFPIHSLLDEEEC